MGFKLKDESGTVEIVSRYSDLVIVKVGDKIKQVSPTQLEETSDSSPPIPGSNSDPVGVAEPTLISSRRKAEKEAPASLMPESGSQEFDLNNSTATEINDSVAGLGRLRSRRLVERRPEEGYKGWNEVAELNSDLNVDWNALGIDHPQVVFRPRTRTA
jgi:hypothetical protein